VSLPTESIHRFTFDCDGQHTSAQVRVSHVESTVSTDGETTYLIGVEFLSMHPALVDQIEQWMGNSGSDVMAQAEA
jgi:hypothetical protein